MSTENPMVAITGCDRLALRVAEQLIERGARLLVVPGPKPDDPEDEDVREALLALADHDARVSVLRGNDIHELADDIAAVAPSAVILCADDDVGNVRDALALREEMPAVRLVVRMFNTRLGNRLPNVLGNCAALSATRIAAGPLADLAVGPGGPGSGPVRRTRFTRTNDAIRGSHGVAVLRQLWNRPLFRWLLAAMLLVAAVETLVLVAVFGHGLDTALIESLTAMLTVGLPDIGLTGARVAREGWWVQGLHVSLMVVDAVLVAVLFGLIADALIGERFARVFGGSARRMRGHVVVAGLGTVGYRLVRELTRRGYRCMAIESDPESPFVTAARALGVGVVIADVRQEDEFAQLGIDRAVAFLGVTDNDAANLEAGLTASSIAPGVRVILRMFDRALGERLERLDGVTACRSVARLAAPAFADAAVHSPAHPSMPPVE